MNIDPKTESGLGEAAAAAQEKAFQIPFDQFKSQVLAYLPADRQARMPPRTYGMRWSFA